MLQNGATAPTCRYFSRAFRDFSSIVRFEADFTVIKYRLGYLDSHTSPLGGTNTHIPKVGDSARFDRLTLIRSHSILGQKYFYHPIRRIVTDSNIRIPGIFRLVAQAASLLDGLALQQQIVFSRTMELTLEVDESQDPPVCRYYYVDHTHKSEFWLEPTTTSDLGLAPVTSMSQLSSTRSLSSFMPYLVETCQKSCYVNIIGPILNSFQCTEHSPSKWKKN